jgi:hypothetical protein
MKKNKVTLTLESEYGFDLRWLKNLIIYECLKKHDWNRMYTAADLGISIRSLRDNIEVLRDAGFDVKKSNFKPFGDYNTKPRPKRKKK